MKQLRFFINCMCFMACIGAMDAGMALAVADDGMPIDAPISDSIELDRNTSYVYVRAMSRVRSEVDGGYLSDVEKELTMGSVLVAPGADVEDITLIFEGDNNILISR